MKRGLNYIRTIFCVIIVASYTVKAQSNGIGPHGGRLKTANNCKIEVAGCDNYLEIYLYDRDTNAINNTNITGNVIFYYNNTAELNVPMVKYGLEGFTAKIPINTFSYSKVIFDINSEFIINQKFENECLLNFGKN